MNKLDKLKLCRVCGFDHGDYTWGEDGTLASFEICDCCGAEFGYYDCNLEAIRRNRKKWIDGGANWSNPKIRPANWNLQIQLQQIPEEYL